SVDCGDVHQVIISEAPINDCYGVLCVCDYTYRAAIQSQSSCELSARFVLHNACHSTQHLDQGTSLSRPRSGKEEVAARWLLSEITADFLDNPSVALIVGRDEGRTHVASSLLGSSCICSQAKASAMYFG